MIHNSIHIILQLRKRYITGPVAGSLCILLLLCAHPLLTAAGGNRIDPPVLYETSVFVVVQGVGGLEIPAMISEDTVYLSVTDVFDFIKVRNSRSSTGDSVSGFFVNEQDLYLIDKAAGNVKYHGQVYTLQKDELISTETGFYMKVDYFGSIFGLSCKFNFRSLSVNVSTKVDLPIVREKRLQLMRENIRRLKGEVKADTAISRSYPLFRLGTADWSVVANQRSPGASDIWLNLGLGATVAGGEATASLNYNNYVKQQVPHEPGVKDIKPFDQRQQYYRWRYVDNDQQGLRQIIAGKIFTQSTASIFDPVVGVQLTNTPATFRRSFGAYTLSNVTEPGWTVELYVNNALVDYTVADANGFYTFQVPLVYGNSQVRLRFFGPWGEERVLEENISIPFTFLPKKEFEYTASAGMVEDSLSSFFSRVRMNYGLTRHITVGGGVEYLSSIPAEKAMPFAATSVRLPNNMLFGAEYTHNVRTIGLFSYRMPSNLQIDLQYTRYKKGQRAIIYNFLEERKLVLAKPFLGKRFSVFSRFTLNQIISPYLNYTTSELLLSGSLFKVGTSLTTYGIFIGQATPLVYSNLGLSFRVPGQLLVMPQVQYAYTSNRLLSARCELGKYFFRNGYLNASYEQNFTSRIHNFQIGLRYDLSFGQVALATLRGNQSDILVASARGSLLYEGKTGYAGVSNRSMLGTGGLILLPFLDLNGNGRRDAGESKVYGLKVSVNGGRIFYRQQDSTIRVTDMEPYATYYFDLKNSSFDNIAWRVDKPVISMMIEPNQLRLVEVPVVVAGEVSGKVLLQEGDGQKGLGRIKIAFYKPDGSLAAAVLTEPDGFFSYLGLAPGSYIAQLDTAQLNKLGLRANPASIPFHLSVNREGDVEDNLRFILERTGTSMVMF